MYIFATAWALQCFVWIAAAANTQNYNILVAAAAKKSATIEVGKSYLLTERQGLHDKIIVGTVSKVDGDLDFDARMTQLRKEEKGIPSGLLRDRLPMSLRNTSLAEQLDPNLPTQRTLNSGVSVLRLLPIVVLETNMSRRYIGPA